MDAERQRDQAERELADIRAQLQELVLRLDVFLFAASFRDDDSPAAPQVEEPAGSSLQASS